MSGAEYTTVVWRCTEMEFGPREKAAEAIETLLADGWQLHGWPIALPGERVLQALVKPAEGQRTMADEWMGLVRVLREHFDAADRARIAGEDAKLRQAEVDPNATAGDILSRMTAGETVALTLAQWDAVSRAAAGNLSATVFVQKVKP